MTWWLWLLTGAAVYFALSLVVGAVVDIEIRDALMRVVSAPITLLIAPLVWIAIRLPAAGRFPLGRFRQELDAWEHTAVGAAGSRWALLILRRGARKPAPAERVP